MASRFIQRYDCDLVDVNVNDRCKGNRGDSVRGKREPVNKNGTKPNRTRSRTRKRLIGCHINKTRKYVTASSEYFLYGYDFVEQ